MATWLRLYTEILDDPKIQRLEPVFFRHWINILCLTSKHKGTLPPIADIAFALRLSEPECEVIIKYLKDHELLDEKRGVLSPHNWEERQYKSDSSTERVKRYRKQHRNVTRNVPETANVTDQNRTDTDTEQIQNRTEQKGTTPPAEKRGGHRDFAADLFQARCLELTGAPYEFQKADFVRLASLRKAYEISSGADPPGWADGVTNYFASPLAKYSIADLCSRYPVFRNSRLNKFKVPINHVNAIGEKGNGRAERTRQATEELLRELDQQNCSSDECGVEQSDASSLSGDAHKPKT